MYYIVLYNVLVHYTAFMCLYMMMESLSTIHNPHEKEKRHNLFSFCYAIDKKILQDSN
jgi:hypothetical protein